MLGGRSVRGIASGIASVQGGGSWPIGPMVGSIVSVFILVVSLTLSTPKTDDLVEVSGTVRNAVATQQGRVRGSEVIFALDDRPDRYRTATLAGYPARVKRLSGSFVRTYVERTPSLPKAYGAAEQTWGLSIDGETVQSLEDALDADRARKHVLLPLIALVLAAVSSIGLSRRSSRARP